MTALNLNIIRHDSPLGQWQMAMAIPGSGLPGVEVLWDVGGVTHYARESILPSGGLEILINLGGPQWLLDPVDEARRATYTTAWVSGLQQQPLVVASQGYAHLVGLRLSPASAWRVLGVPLHHITGQVVNLDLVIPDLPDLRQRLGDEPDPAQRLRLLAAFVQQRLLAGPGLHPAVATAYAMLIRQRGHVELSDLLDATGCSQRHLARKFHEQVGLGPKRFSKLLRFRQAVETLQRSASVELGLLAQDCGYYDQAHFNRDFREFAGASPTDFLRRRLPDEVTAAMAG